MRYTYSRYFMQIPRPVQQIEQPTSDCEITPFIRNSLSCLPFRLSKDGRPWLLALISSVREQ